MDTNSTPLSSSSPFPSIQTEVVTVPPTIFPHVGYSILSFLMFINTVLSVFNNSLVIAVMLRNSALLQPMNVLILNLAVSDLMIGLCGSLVVTITNYQGSYFIGHTACMLQGFSVNYFGKFSCYTLCFCVCVCFWSSDFLSVLLSLVHKITLYYTILMQVTLSCIYHFTLRTEFRSSN